jgi:hypothetical protein
MIGPDDTTTGRRPARALPVVDRPTWEIARRLCVVGLAAFGLGFLAFPEATATLFWWALVPALPVLFLLHPSIWRNVCPLATLSMGREPEAAAAGAAARPSPWAGAAGVLPFLVLVAWRGTGLEARPMEAGGLLLGLTVFAVFTGRRGTRRDGFCNRFCPLLPIERAYGQRPLVAVHDTRCPSCTLCTPRGCLDLSATAAVPQLLGPRRQGSEWLLTPFGAFAAALPGFIVAYFLTTPSEPEGILRLAGTLALGLMASWTLAVVFVWLTRPRWSAALPTLGALSAGLYYGFAAPSAAVAWGWAPEVGVVLQVALVLFVLTWWRGALRSVTGSRARA